MSGRVVFLWFIVTRGVNILGRSSIIVQRHYWIFAKHATDALKQNPEFICKNALNSSKITFQSHESNLEPNEMKPNITHF